MGTSGLQTLQSLKEGADYPNYWGQETKRHLDAKRPCTNNRPRTVGNTGEVHFSHLDGGGRQRARSTRLPERWKKEKKDFFFSLIGRHKGRGLSVCYILADRIQPSPQSKAPKDPGRDGSIHGKRIFGLTRIFGFLDFGIRYVPGFENAPCPGWVSRTGSYR